MNKSNKKKADKLTEQKARELLEKQNKENVDNCSAEVQEVLEKHNCAFNVSVIVTQNGNYPQLRIVNKK